jgi:adenine-specific DNA-methyltransferase
MWVKKADELLKKVETIETEQKDNFDKISKTVKDSVLIVTGETKVKEKKSGIGGSFTYATLGEPINLDNMLQGTMPSFDESAISSSHYYIGESKTHRVYLIYQAKADFLRTEEAALDKDKLNTIGSLEKLKQSYK